MISPMKHYYPDVPTIGNVAVSRHAQDNMAKDKITELQFEHALFNGRKGSEPGGIITREAGGVRVIILERPKPFAGAMLVKTVYRIKAQARSR